ncbi:protein kinase domain-containing protein [Geodermatophilus sp. URMC 60]
MATAGGERELVAAMAALITGQQVGDDQFSRLLTADDASFINATAELLTGLLSRINAYELENSGRTFRAAADEAVATARQRMTSEADLADAGRRARLLGALAAVALTTRLMQRRLSPPTRPSTPHDDDVADLFAPDLGLRQSIYALYDPDIPVIRSVGASFPRTPLNPRVRREWEKLVPGTFTYHKAGTTSFILRCHTDECRDPQGRANDCHDDNGVWFPGCQALKCVLYPWNEVPSIASATVEYADRYRNAPAIVVEPITSSARWILMPFVEGETLADRLARRGNDELEIHARIALAADVAHTLVGALDELARGRRLADVKEAHQHLDLSPNNIIVTRAAAQATPSTVRLIDLGANHLYTRQVGLTEHGDSVYVSPEVKNRGLSVTSDLYSVATILVSVLATEPPLDGRVPDEVYEVSPALGAMLDDFLDEDPGLRLVLVPKLAECTFDDLRRRIDQTFKLVGDEPVARRSAVSRLIAKYAPASREPSSLIRQYWDSRQDLAFGESPGSAAYQAFWSVVAAGAWWFVFAATALFGFDDLVVGDVEGLPRGMALSAAIIGFCQGLTASKFYQTILARLTVKSTRERPSDWLPTEVLLRVATLVAVPTAALAAFGHAEYWAWSCAAGALLLTLCNTAMRRFAHRSNREGAAVPFTTVPSQGKKALGQFEQWPFTMLIYAVIIFVIAAGLQWSFLEDLPAYTAGLALVSVGIHYVSKSAIAGPSVRGVLTRAVATARRVHALRNAPPGEIPGCREAVYAGRGGRDTT